MRPGHRWIFGYGSLIFRPGFVVVDERVATLRGYTRRFWQYSPDHRGTPEAPGLVLTLVPDDGEVCVGVAFLVDVDDALLRELDHREKAGYSRKQLSVTLHGDNEDAQDVIAIVYVGDVDNAHFASDLAVDDIAAHIASARGPSGDNTSYVLRLDDALAARGIVDAHVRAVATRLRVLTSTG